MQPLHLATKYMEILFSNGDLDQLHEILADNLKFEGPLFTFDSADSYIKSLKKDPPIDFNYELIKSYEDATSACLVYIFNKPGITTTMFQTFETKNNKITGILLVFDTSVFN